MIHLHEWEKIAEFDGDYKIESLYRCPCDKTEVRYFFTEPGLEHIKKSEGGEYPRMSDNVAFIAACAFVLFLLLLVLI